MFLAVPGPTWALCVSDQRHNSIVKLCPTPNDGSFRITMVELEYCGMLGVSFISLLIQRKIEVDKLAAGHPQWAYEAYKFCWVG